MIWQSYINSCNISAFWLIALLQRFQYLSHMADNSTLAGAIFEPSGLQSSILFQILAQQLQYVILTDYPTSAAAIYVPSRWHTYFNRCTVCIFWLTILIEHSNISDLACLPSLIPALLVRLQRSSQFPEPSFGDWRYSSILVRFGSVDPDAKGQTTSHWLC